MRVCDVDTRASRESKGVILGTLAAAHFPSERLHLMLARRGKGRSAGETSALLVLFN